MRSAEELLGWLEAHRDADRIAGMARVGIRTDRALGVSLPLLRARAKAYRRQREAALALWESGVHEARILAGRLARAESAPARWVGRDALRELTAPRTLEFIAVHRR